MAEKQSRTWLWILLGFLALGLMGFIFIIGVVAMFDAGPPPIHQGVLEVVFTGPMTEGPPTDPFSALFSSFETGGRSLWDLRLALEKAASDPKVQGLRVDFLGDVGWGVADEIVALIEDFKASGKPVYCYIRGDFAGDQQYYIATLGDRLWLTPESGLMVNGLRFEAEFYRGTMDKLKIVPDYLMMEEYKSAGEAYSRREMSEPFREQLTALGEDVQERMIAGIAQRRKLDPESVAETVDLGLLTATEAVEKGWVDELGFVDELKAALAQAVGEEEYVGIPLSRYSASVRSRVYGKRVALVFGEGAISASGSPIPFQGSSIQGDRLAGTLKDAGEADDVEAVVFRVNSPGGSPVGSDHIWRAIENIQEAGKPVVVSMSDVAGSGGYWVAMGADRIVAQPTTITGSIGVVFGKLNLRGFYDEWLGINVSDVTLAKNADILSLFEPLEAEHEERFRTWMNEVYTHFQSKVAEGRGLEPEKVAELAKGRIWSGIDALELGLVDELGGLGEALALARELADLPEDTPVQVFPKKKSLFEILASGDLAVAVRAAYASPKSSPQEWLTQASPTLMRDLMTPRPWVLMPRIHVD